MRIRITTNLDRDSVLNSLRALVEANEGLVGVVNHNHVSVACRDWLDVLAPRVRVAAFLRRVVNASQGAVIDGNVETHWSGWLASALMVSVIMVGVVATLRGANYVALGVVALGGIVALAGWWMYVQGTKRHIVAEICRASRGSVA